MMVFDKGYDVCRGEDVYYSYFCCLGGYWIFSGKWLKKLLNEKD